MLTHRNTSYSRFSTNICRRRTILIFETPSANPAGMDEVERHRLTFVSHAGEEKPLVSHLLSELNEQNVASFFDDNMVVGIDAETEMKTRAAEAHQAVVVLSWSFLTKKWPMKELNIFLEKGIDIHLLYYKVTPDDLGLLLAKYDSQAGDDKDAFARNMKADTKAWLEFIAGVRNDFMAGPVSQPTSLILRESAMVAKPSLPDPLVWREDIGRLAKMTGLRSADFGYDESSYVKSAARKITPPRLPRELPELPEHFVRPSLVDTVVSELVMIAPGKAKHHRVLTGMGGAGKSLTASAIARNKALRTRFRDGILWLEDSPGDFSEQNLILKLTKLGRDFQGRILSRHIKQGRSIQYDAIDFKNLEQAWGFFVARQKEQHDLRCLLVVDNVWNKKVLETADAMGFHVLATTRNEDAVPTGPRWFVQPVLPMKVDDSLLVLQKCSGALREVPRAAGLEVVKDCASLPLALAIVASTSTVRDDPLSADAWCKLHEELENKDKMQRKRGAQQVAIFTALSVSLDHLGEEQQQQFRSLAVLAHGVDAPLEMLEHLWEKSNPHDAQVALDGLVGRSLMSLKQDRYGVHDLILDFAKLQILTNRPLVKGATLRQARYLGRSNVVRGYSGAGQHREGLYALIALWRSVEELSDDKELEAKTYKDSLRPLEGGDMTVDVAQVFEDVGTLFMLQGKYEESGPLYERSLAVREECLGPDHPGVAASLDYSAKLVEQQEKEAEPLHQRCLAVDEKVYGPDHPEVAADLNNWAGLLESRLRALRCF
ncbi:unnamed protein product [Scytosiphon promiscuus]